MTCGKDQKCVLCQPGPFQRRDEKGRFIAGKIWPTSPSRPSPYWVEGHLVSAWGKVLKDNSEPHLEFCEGCLKRMGVKIPTPGRVEVLE